MGQFKINLEVIIVCHIIFDDRAAADYARHDRSVRYGIPTAIRQRKTLIDDHPRLNLLPDHHRVVRRFRVGHRGRRRIVLISGGHVEIIAARKVHLDLRKTDVNRDWLRGDAIRRRRDKREITLHILVRRLLARRKRPGLQTVLFTHPGGSHNARPITICLHNSCIFPVLPQSHFCNLANNEPLL